ncbi:hypothetical protein B5M09_009705, partial [Aphanomyces astaci]
TRTKINQQKLGKYLQPCYSDGKYKSGLEMDDDLVALSYIQQSVHNDHLKYIEHVETTYDSWNALKAIYENTSEVSLVTLEMKMYKLDWTERIGLESFADQFQELTRKMTAAGDGTPERSHVTRFLCLLPPRFANTVSYITRESRDTTMFATMRSVLEELKLDDERQQLSNPSLRKNADRSDDALNATVNGECHYCHKPVHFRSECRRRQNDEAKGVQRRNVRDKPQGNGRNSENSRGGGCPNWRGADHGNYAEEVEMEDIFMIEEDLPVASCPDDEDTWWQIDVDPVIELETNNVSTELCQYATDETYECNAATAIVTAAGATLVVAAAPTHEEEPRESRWDRSHRPSTKKQSTSPGRTKQTAMDGLDAARHEARATAVESKRSASRNKIRASATTAQPERKATDRGQSPHKTMRTEGTRGVAPKVPWQHPIDQDDSSDAANAAYDVCFNATDEDVNIRSVCIDVAKRYPVTFKKELSTPSW